MKQNKKIAVYKFVLMLMSSALMLVGCSNKSSTTTKTADTSNNTAVVSKVHSQKYQLEKVVILSRHNVRAPLSKKGSDLYNLTPHKWNDWSSNAGELSSLGGSLETVMGQYFRKYLIKQRLFKENEQPAASTVRFYANSMQRTIATAQYFSSGFLPVANVKIEHKYKLNTMDPVFSPQLSFTNKRFKKESLTEIAKMGGKKGFSGIEENLQPNYKLLAKVLDLKDSDKAKKEGYSNFPTNDLKVHLKLHNEPTATGSLQLATTASDALVLQYYEEADSKKAGFGKNLTAKQWEDIAHIKDVYGNVLFAAPAVAENVAHPLLKEIKHDLSNNSQKFVFLCGHDSNITSVLAALNFKQYALPESIEKTTPIGGKLVMELWKNKQNQHFVTFKMVYLSVDQLRHLQTVDLKNPPMVYDLSLNGESKNSDGMYPYNNVIKRFSTSINAYNQLKTSK